MYQPIQPCIPSTLKHKITYKETAPAAAHRAVVHCYWALRTRAVLEDDFQYVVLPDGCLDIVLDASETPSCHNARIMTPAATVMRLNLGKTFHYVGIRLQPGAWMDSYAGIVGGSVRVDKLGGCDFRLLRQQLAASTAHEQTALLHRAVTALKQREVIGENTLISSILRRSALSVDDITAALGYSRRHVQRLLQQSVGLKPREFIRIVRFQQSLTGAALAGYADQSHYIRECKRVTGMTPRTFRSTFL